MKVLTPGHLYELDSMEGTNPQRLQFIEKISAAEAIKLGMDCTIQGNGLVTVNDGTTNEEVLRVLRDRLKVLYEKLPSPETAGAIVSLTHALELLNRRTANRLAQGVENTPLPHFSPDELQK